MKTKLAINSIATRSAQAQGKNWGRNCYDTKDKWRNDHCRRLLFTCENLFFSSQNETYFNTMLLYTKIYKNKRIDEESRKFRTTTEFESFVSLLLRDNTSEAMSYQLPMCWFQSSMVMARSEGNSLLPSVISWKVRSPNFSRKILILRFKRIIFLLQTILPLQN